MSSSNSSGLLTSTNYLQWRRQFKGLCLERRYWGAIYPEQQPLPPLIAKATVALQAADEAATASDQDTSDLDEEQVDAGIHHDKLSASARRATTIEEFHLLVNLFMARHVSSDFSSFIEETRTPRANWDYLEQLFQPQLEQMRQATLDKIIHLRMTGEQTVLQFYGTFKGLYSQYHDLGGTRDDTMQREMFFSKLHPRFDNARAQYLGKPDITLEAIVTNLQLHHNDQASRSGAANNNSRATGRANAAGFSKPARSGTSGSAARSASTSTRRQNQEGGAPRAPKGPCPRCGQHGHWASACTAPAPVPRDQWPASSAAAPARAKKSVAFSLAVKASTPAPAPVPTAHTPSYSNYDRQDFMLEQSIFHELNERLGPFTVDACADPDGNNSFCTTFYSKDNSFIESDLRGETIWCNPPFATAGKFIQHYKQQKQLDPSISACFVLPDDPSKPWWDLVQGFQRIQTWEAGQQLFTMPVRNGGGVRRRHKPCPFPVVVLYDPPHRTKVTGNAAKPVNPWHKHRLPPLVIDSGCSVHMAPNRAIFTNYTAGPPPDGPFEVEVADRGLIPIQGYGEVFISSTVKGEEHVVNLRRVLHCPDLSTGLLSVSDFTKRGASVLFRNNYSNVYVEDQHVLHARQDSGTSLYHLLNVSFPHADQPDSVATACTAGPGPAGGTTTPKAEPSEPSPGTLGLDLPPAVKPAPAFGAEHWHQRLGHLNYQSLAKLTKMTKGINVPAADFISKGHDPDKCPACMAGKMCRSHRGPREEHTEIPLHRVSADLCGPFQVIGLQGERYFLLAIDEATKYSAIKVIKSKDKAVAGLLDILNFMEAISSEERFVKRLRTDRGLEFCNAQLEEACRTRRMVHEPVPAYSPESNGQVERCNRTLLEKARAMLHHAGLPPSFWSEAVIHANFLRNVSPTSMMAATPYQLLRGKVPDLTNVKIFGSLAYVFVPAALRKKLEDKSQPAVWTGCDLEHASSRVYILQTGTLKESRDVICDETKLAWPQASGDVSHDPFTLDPAEEPAATSPDSTNLPALDPAGPSDLELDLHLDLETPWLHNTELNTSSPPPLPVTTWNNPAFEPDDPPGLPDLVNEDSDLDADHDFTTSRPHDLATLRPNAATELPMAAPTPRRSSSSMYSTSR